jgi:hypothetical protein
VCPSFSTKNTPLQTANPSSSDFHNGEAKYLS